MTRPRIYAALSVLLAFSVFVCMFSLRRKDDLIEKTKPMMGTFVEIKVPVAAGQDRKEIEEGVDKAFGEIERVEGVFSVFRPESEISRINRLKKGESIVLSDEAFGLIEKSVRYSGKTTGAFDITAKPLVDLWMVGGAKREFVPAESDIRKALLAVGSQYLALDAEAKTIAFTRDGMGIDMGGVAKGHAVDMAVESLKRSGIKNAIVNCGGDMYCMGTRLGARPWKVGAQHPRKETELLFEIDLKDKAIDTSGDYEKYYILNGRRYSHIINPRTGYPEGDSVVSATVIADDSAAADMLATALCVTGPAGIAAICETEGADAIVFYIKDGKLLMDASSRLEDKYNVRKRKTSL